MFDGTENSFLEVSSMDSASSGETYSVERSQKDFLDIYSATDIDQYLMWITNSLSLLSWSLQGTSSSCVYSRVDTQS